MKKVLALIFVFVFVFNILGTFSFAYNENMLFEYKLYTGTVWLLNDENSTVILQNVKTKNKFGAQESKLDLEYKEIPIIAQNIFYKDGEKLSFDTINTYMLDRKVTFIAAKNAYYYKILYMEVQ